MKIKSCVFFLFLLVLVCFFTINNIYGDDNSPSLKKNECELFYIKSFIPDIETFMNIGYAGSSLISPDGRKIYFNPGFTHVRQIFRMDETSSYPYQLTFLKGGAKGMVLSPHGKLAIVLTDRGGDEQYQLNLMDADTGRIEALTNRPEVRHEGVIWSPRSDKIYFRATLENKKDFNIYEMDLKTRKVRILVKDPGYHSTGDISTDGRYLVYIKYESNTDNNIYILDINSGGKKLITPHKGNYLFYNCRLSPDNKKIYCITNMNEQEVMKFSSVDIDTGEINILLDKDSPWEVDKLELNPSKTVAGLTVNENGYGNIHLIDLITMKELPVPNFRGIVSSISMSNTETVALDYSTPVRAGEVYTWNWKTKELKQWTRCSYAGIDPSVFIEPSLVHYKSFDGLEIPAFLYLPPDYKDNMGNIPFIIDFHGGPEGQSRPYFTRHYNYLLLNGYGVITPNVRGSSGYGKKYKDLDNYKKRMDSVKDGYYCAKYLLDEGYTRQGKIGIKGGSYGGYMVMALITEYPDMWGAAMESVGIADVYSFLKNTSEYRRSLREPEYGPLSDPEFLKSISPINKIDRVKTPLMVVHGKNDPRVPVSEAYAIIENLQKRGVPVEPLIFEDEGHSIGKKDNRMLEYRKLIEFFDKYLKNQ